MLVVKDSDILAVAVAVASIVTLGFWRLLV
jgi:hypothetical protein